MEAQQKRMILSEGHNWGSLVKYIRSHSGRSGTVCIFV